MIRSFLGHSQKGKTRILASLCPVQKTHPPTFLGMCGQSRHDFTTSTGTHQNNLPPSVRSIDKRGSTGDDDATNRPSEFLQSFFHSNTLTLSPSISEPAMQDKPWKRALRYFMKTVPVDHPISQQLTQRIDQILKESGYTRRQDAVMQRKKFGLWYLANDMCVHYSVIRRVLVELDKRFPALQKNSMFVYGGYTGAPIWAAYDLWGSDKRRGGLRQAVSIEDHDDCAGFTRKLLMNTGVGVQVAAGIERMNRSNQAPYMNIQQPIVLAAFSLGRVTGAARKELIESLWRQVKEDGVLILIDNGDPVGFERIRIARDYLLHQYGKHRHPLAGASAEPVSSSSSPSLDFERDLSTPSPRLQRSPSKKNRSVDPSTLCSVIAPCTHDHPCPQQQMEVGEDGKMSKPANQCVFIERVLRGRMPGRAPLKFKVHSQLGPFALLYSIN